MNKMTISTDFVSIALSNLDGGVWELKLNRADRLNAIGDDLFDEMPKAIDELIQSHHDVRALILLADGKHFCAGLDLSEFSLEKYMSGKTKTKDIARSAYHLRNMITHMQRMVSCLNDAPFPIIAAIHGACIGGGVDIISACDIRFCTQSAFFSVKEVDIGMAADMGTLQHLPKIVGSDSWVRDLALTGRRADSTEALRFGLVSRVLCNRDELITHAINVARNIASKSPVAVQVTKDTLNFSRDHSVKDGLRYVAATNAAMLQNEDIPVAGRYFLERSTTPPIYAKL